MRAQRIVAAVERAAAKWPSAQRDALWPSPASTHARAVDLDGWRERLAEAAAKAPGLPARAWRFTFVVAVPLEHRGQFVDATEGGRPAAMLRSASSLACVARGYAAAIRGTRGKVTAVEAAR